MFVVVANMSTQRRRCHETLNQQDCEGAVGKAANRAHHHLNAQLIIGSLFRYVVIIQPIARASLAG